MRFERVHERGHREHLCTYARVHAFNGYLYTNKRTVHYTRARTYTRTSRSADKRIRCASVRAGGGVGGRGRTGRGVRRGRGRRRRRATETEKHTSQVQRAKRPGPSSSVTNSSFFSPFPPSSELLSCRGSRWLHVNFHAGDTYTGGVLIVETSHRTCLLPETKGRRGRRPERVKAVGDSPVKEGTARRGAARIRLRLKKKKPVGERYLGMYSDSIGKTARRATSTGRAGRRRCRGTSYRGGERRESDRRGRRGKGDRESVEKDKEGGRENESGRESHTEKQRERSAAQRRRVKVRATRQQDGVGREEGDGRGRGGR